MIERSSSHKSDGRQSSAGQSNHSARTNSLGLEPSNLLGRVGNTTDTPSGPPPGLFILGPVPSIIRCWLDTNFSNESLLYAAVCTGSYRSFLSPDLVSHLGLQDQVRKDENGTDRVKIHVYLPEATVQQATSSRSGSPTPQLPALTVNFTVQGFRSEGRAIQIFIGSDVLRTQNADILLSQDRMTLCDDSRHKLSIPLVRPEDATIYKGLITCAQASTTDRAPSNGVARQDPNAVVNSTASIPYIRSVEVNGAPNNMSGSDRMTLSTSSINISASAEGSTSGDGHKFTGSQGPREDSPALARDDKIEPSSGPENASVAGAPTRTESGSIWGSWRRDSTANIRADMAPSSNNTTGSGYQRAGRGRGMKVLKPAKLGTTPSSRSFSATQTSTGFEAAPPRFVDPGGRRGSQTAAKADDRDDQHSIEARGSFSSSGDAKSSTGLMKDSLAVASSKSRSANPIGGASAFGWLNSSQQKRSTAAAD